MRKKTTLGVIVGNRDFFPDALVSEARQDILEIFEELDIEAVIVDEDVTKLGGVETWEHAKRCAALFRERANDIDGILVCLPNFGDEKGVADTIKLSRLEVPILVQAYPDDLDALIPSRRRDAFCGKISVCNNLYQYGYPYSVTDQHTIHPKTEEFKTELLKFIGVCRVVNGLKNARLGAIGARPNAFNTTRYSEKLLQAVGISVSTLDLSVVLGAAPKIADDDSRVKTKLDSVNAYVRTDGVPARSLVKMAKLGIVIEDWMNELDLNASAIQCWDSLQQNYGVNVCTIMSMMSEQFMPSACEVDITGTVSMFALQQASGRPSALVDWNNNYGGDPNKCVLFHCGNWAKSFFDDFEMGYAPILGSTLGDENTFGIVDGRTPAGPLCYARVTTDDRNGRIHAYVGDGVFTNDPLETFGSRAVAEIPELQQLLRYVCKSGFEHHVAMNASHVAGILKEAFQTYFGWDVYHHLG
jgi:L-fucose isomerase-like protein